MPTWKQFFAELVANGDFLARVQKNVVCQLERSDKLPSFEGVGDDQCEMLEEMIKVHYNNPGEIVQESELHDSK